MTEKDKLIEMIEKSETVRRYRRLEALINNSETIKTRMNELKKLQQQMINAREMGKTSAHDDFKTRYERMKEEIEAYPLVGEYLFLQAEINEAIQHIIEAISDKINDHLRL